MPRSAISPGTITALTGAAHGIGRSLAFGLARSGAVLHLIDRDADALDATIRDLRREVPGIRIRAAAVDITDPEAVRTLISDIDRTSGRIDLLINNAGIGGETAILDDLTESEMRRVMEVNYWGTVRVTMAMLPLLRRSPAGILGNVSSVAGLMGIMGALPYSASKSAVRGFTESLRLELKDDGIRVVQIHPGVVHSSIIDNLEYLPEELKAVSRQAFRDQPGLSCDEAARIILRGINSDRDRILVGRDSRLGDWLVRTFPNRYAGWVHANMKNTVRKLSGEAT